MLLNKLKVAEKLPSNLWAGLVCVFNILFIFVQNVICAILALPQQLNFSCLLRFTIISCGHDVFSLPTNAHAQIFELINIC